MQTNLLKAKMITKSMTQEDLAKEINMSLSTLNGKINGKVEFNNSEIKKIKDALSLDAFETDSIFFA